MSAPRAFLLDFFGTLVEYSPSWTEQGYEHTHVLLRDLGVELEYDRFLQSWSESMLVFSERAAVDHVEYSMHDVGESYLASLLGRPPMPADLEGFVTSYLAEWDTGVRYLDGVADLVRRLAERFRLAVVSNTNHPRLVPDHLAAMGVLEDFDAVVLSIDLGRRKPHAAIYEEALSRLGSAAEDACFVGDSLEPDYLRPRACGIPALLIDPLRRARVPEAHRIASILELERFLN